jgi:DNA-binding IclR family transcriptional regulator
MARPAPGAERTIAVLNWLAAHPDQAFTLTDLVRGLGLNGATCHALLAALAEAGYVYRDSAKAYRLGPALAAMGEIARQCFLPVAVVRDDMRALSESLDLVCLAAGRVGLEMVILDRAAPAAHLATAVKQGARFTIEGPRGLAFIAWSAHADADQWLEALRRTRGEAEHRQWADAIQTVRQLGFSFGPLRPTGAATAPRSLSPEDRLELNYISAPVLSEAEEIIFCLVLQGFDRAYQADEILEIGARLRSVCEAARKRIYGRAVGSATQRL